MTFLSKIVSINSKFCRSINIFLDINDSEILKNYIRSIALDNSISNIFGNIKSNGQGAYTLTGPYGSGKSSLALVISSLFSEDKNLQKISKKIVGKENLKLVNSVIKKDSSWEVLPITGDLCSPEELVKQSLIRREYKLTDDLLSDLTKISNDKDGILILFDEMGKCLENAVKDDGDIYFLQKLAEIASRSNGKIIFIGILHQSFAEYAKRMPRSIRDEWTKIQGRFVDIPVNVAGEEQIELIGRAIDSGKVKKEISPSLLDCIVDNIALSRNVQNKELLKNTLEACWPICPLVVCLLAQMSRKSFGQNQRSIFSFLNSGEPKAFKEFIERTEFESNLIYSVDTFYDYLQFNFEPTILASSDSKLWSVAKENIARCRAKGASDIHLNILKTICLIDVFAGSSGITSTFELLSCLYPNDDVKSVLDDLSKWSVINYKNYAKTYSIFEGSDFNFDQAMKDAYLNVGEANLAKLSEIANFKPIMAKRHYHQYGCMRWMDFVFSPVTNFLESINEEFKGLNSVGLFSIVIPENADEQIKSLNLVTKPINTDFPVLVTVAKNSSLLKEYLKDLFALEWIEKNCNELEGDHVARNELLNRKETIIVLLEQQINLIIANSVWFKNGNSIGVVGINKLSKLVSDVCDEVYSKTLVIKSELINRSKPSGSANSALNALLKHMVLNNGENELGISGTKPEKGLFNILLANTGLYTNHEYCIPVNNDHLNSLWTATDNLIRNNEKSLSMDNVYAMWAKPPFGVKKGLFNFLALAYILSHSKELVIYKDRLYQTGMTDILVDYMIKTPSCISVKFADISNESKQYIDAIKTVLNDFYNQKRFNDHSSLLLLGQALVSFVYSLHPWVLKTKSLSKIATRFRDILKTANDPNKAILEDIKKLIIDQESNTPVESQVKEKLPGILKELAELYPNTMTEVGLLITSELDVPLVTPHNLELLRERAKNIKDVSGNFRINAFAARISTFEESFDSVAGIIGLANSKPPSDWIDLDLENAKKELLILCTEFKKTELYTKIKNRHSSRQGIAFITGIGGKSKIIEGEFDLLESNNEQVLSVKNSLMSVVQSGTDKNVLLAALTQLIIDNVKEKE